MQCFVETKWETALQSESEGNCQVEQLRMLACVPNACTYVHTYRKDVLTTVGTDYYNWPKREEELFHNFKGQALHGPRDRTLHRHISPQQFTDMEGPEILP